MGTLFYHTRKKERFCLLHAFVSIKRTKKNFALVGLQIFHYGSKRKENFTISTLRNKPKLNPVRMEHLLK